MNISMKETDFCVKSRDRFRKINDHSCKIIQFTSERFIR